MKKEIPVYECGDFTTPPENQGQIIEVSYALAVNFDDPAVIVARKHDRSDNTTTYTAYAARPEDEEWDPQNGAPRLGQCFGECRIR
jgi:hypothetical protein